jgi:hypothetical protein
VRIEESNGGIDGEALPDGCIGCTGCTGCIGCIGCIGCTGCDDAALQQRSLWRCGAAKLISVSAALARPGDLWPL